MVLMTAPVRAVHVDCMHVPIRTVKRLLLRFLSSYREHLYPCDKSLLVCEKEICEGENNILCVSKACAHYVIMLA